jgi:hypothetical protein
MTIRRRATAVGAAVLSLAALSACGSKPTPMTSLGSGTAFASTEASCYNDGRQLKARQMSDCEGFPVKTIKVKEGSKVRFGVDKDVAEEGWFISVGQQQTSRSERTYLTFDADALFRTQQGQALPEVDISIIESPDRNGQSIHGVWRYKLVREDA